MRWSSARILVCALCLVGLVLLPQTTALACVCNDAHAIWWQQQHHSGGVIGFLRDGDRGSEAGAALVAVALIGLVGGCIVRARRNRKAVITTDNSESLRTAGDPATPAFRLGRHIREDPLPASIPTRANRRHL
jgi:hypothetical protein